MKEMKKQTLKIAVALLLILSTLFCFGCSNKGDEDGGDTPADSSVSTADDDGYVKDQLPDDLKYGGKTVSIIHWVSEVTEFNCTSLTGDLINDACFKRDKKVEERLDVKLEYIQQVGGPNDGEVTEYCNAVQNASAAGDYYDLVAAYGRTAATLAYQGYLADLLDIEKTYLNFENPWWSSGLLEELSVGNSLYLATGDITPSVVQMAQGVWYNTDLINDYKLVDPYEHVKNNTWNLGTLNEYIKNVEAAAGENSGKYAVVSTYYDVASLFHGTGIRLMTKGDDGYPVMNPDLYGEKAIDVMKTLGDWAKTQWFYVGNNATVADTQGAGFDEASYDLFTSNKALFVTANINASMHWAKNMTSKYSIVPSPKYNTDQTEYYSTLHNSITCYAAMKGQKQVMLSQISAVLECMGSEGYRRIIPSVYETCLLSRYIDSVNTEEMLRLISSTVTYDFGRIYSMKSTNFLCDRIGRIVQQNPKRTEYNLTWSSFGEAQGSSTENSFNNIIDSFKSMS